MAKRIQIVVATTGGAGVSAGTGRAGIPGGMARLLGVQVDYNAAAPATSDLVLTAVIGGVTKTVLTLTNVNTDFPMQQVMELAVDELGAQIDDAAGPPEIEAHWVHPIVQGDLIVTLAQFDDLDPAATVDVVLELI